MTRAFRTELMVPVIDVKTGAPMMVGSIKNRQPLVRKIPNAPIRFFFGDVPVVILDWSNMASVVRQKVKDHRADQRAKNVELTPSDKLNEFYWLEVLKEPVEYEGHKYYGWYSWGSSVKNGQTIGLTEDHLLKCGLCSKDVHFLYSMAILLPNGIYGGAVFEDAKVLLLPEGAEFAGQVIADGFGVIGDMTYQVARNDTPPIKLQRTASNNYQVAQRLDWDVVAEEVIQMVREKQDFFNRAGYDITLRWVENDVSEYKLKLIEADETMRYHPYIAGQRDDTEAEYAAELASSVPFDGVTRIAVPTKDSVGWVYDPGRHMLVRWPVDAATNLKAVDIKKAHADLERIKKLVTAQIRWSQANPKYPTVAFSKGMVAVVPQEDMQGYDMVICDKDLKMVNGDLDAIRAEVKAKGSYVLNVPGESVLTITQAYKAGTAIGCPISPWKRMGGDFDGDLVTVYFLDKWPIIWNHVASFKSSGSYKVVKQYSDPDNRVRMIWNSLHMQIGRAVNTVSSSFIVPIKERWKIAELVKGPVQKAITFLGSEYVWADELSTLDKFEFWCTIVVKQMTDGFKSSRVKLKLVAANLSSVASFIKQAYLTTAPWTTWENGYRGQKWAFRHGLPEFRDALSPAKKAFFAAPGDKSKLSEAEWMAHIEPSIANCTIVRIYALWKDWMAEKWSREHNKLNIFEWVATLPLSHFAAWVPQVAEEDLVSAMEVKREYDAVIPKVQWGDGGNGEEFKATWAKYCEDWVAQFDNREYGIWCLWRAAHHARGELSRAALVFIAFPDECLDIVKNKPGRKENQTKGLLLGVEKNVFGKTRKRYPAVKVRVVQDRILGGMKTFAEVFHVEDFPNLMRTRPANVPVGLIGTFGTVEPSRARQGFEVPMPGEYVMSLSQMEGKGGSYIAYLTKISKD